jgi:hypothetical protein
MIEWKEREHEMDDLAALRSPRTRAALRACGLLKFFKLQKMKREILLLEHMIGLVGCYGTGIPHWYTTPNY